jgi:hypothetical protein
MTADIVNLRLHRKRKAREEKDSVARQNRLAFGQPKDKKQLAKKRRELDARTLDGHKRET